MLPPPPQQQHLQREGVRERRTEPEASARGVQSCFRLPPREGKSIFQGEKLPQLQPSAQERGCKHDFDDFIIHGEQKSWCFPMNTHVPSSPPQPPNHNKQQVLPSHILNV